MHVNGSSINTSSSISTENASADVTQKMGLAEIKAKRIREFALNFLGKGYIAADNSEAGLLERAFVKFSAELVDILKAENRHEEAVGTSYQNATDELKKKFEVKFDLECPVVTVENHALYGTSRKSKEEENKIVFVASHINYHKCQLNQTPKQRRDLHGREQRGDQYVRAVWIYTGYKIFFEIDIQSHLHSSHKNLHAGTKAKSNVAFKGFTIGGGFKGKILSEKLQGKSIEGIKMTAKGFGDYSIPSSKFHLPKNVEEIGQVLETIEKDYLEKIDHIITRDFFIDEACLAPYPSQALRPPLLTSQNTSSLRKKDFNELAKEIDLYHKNTLQRQLGSVKLEDLLNSLDRVFSKMFARGFEKVDGRAYTLVMGESSSGKSALIGYLTNARIIYQKNKSGKKVAIYDPRSSGIYPKIGHGGSKTKGIEVFGNYIDTAGCFDTEGTSEDIMNSVAIHIATRSYEPKKLIVVLNSQAFNKRSRIFLEMIDRLTRIVLGSNSEQVLSSILFVVNDKLASKKDERKTKDDIIHLIDQTIEQLEAEKQDLLDKDIPRHMQVWRFTPKSWAAWFTEISPEEQEKERKKINPRVGELQERITLLEKVKKLDNIIVSDIFSGTSRSEIQNKKNSINDTPPLSFCMKNLVEDGNQIFQSFILATTAYFNSLFENQIKKGKDLLQIQEEITNLQESLKNEPNTYTKIKIQSLEKQLIEINKEIEDLENHSKELNSKETEIWKDLAKDKIISERSLWHFLPIKHRFEQISPIGDMVVPIDHVKLNPPRGDYNNGHFCNEKEENNSKGKYQVTFKQGWRAKARTVEVQLYIMKKHHPATQAELKRIESFLDTKKASKRDVEEQLNNFRNKNDCRNEQESLSEKLLDLKSQYNEVGKDLEMLQLKMSKFSDYRRLIVQLIVKLEIHSESTNDSERKIYEDFINFSKDFEPT